MDRVRPVRIGPRLAAVLVTAFMLVAGPGSARDPGAGGRAGKGVARTTQPLAVSPGCTRCREGCMVEAIRKLEKEKVSHSSKEYQGRKNRYFLDCLDEQCNGKGDPCAPKDAKP